MVYLAPKTPTSRFPMHLLQLAHDHWLTRLPLFNRLSYFAYDWLAWRPLRALVDEFGRERPGLARLPWWSGPRERTACACSPSTSTAKGAGF